MGDAPRIKDSLTKSDSLAHIFTGHSAFTLSSTGDGVGTDAGNAETEPTGDVEVGVAAGCEAVGLLA